MKSPIRIPYGRGHIEWTPAPGDDVRVLEADEPAPLPDPVADLERELETPLESDSLEHLAAGKHSATIVVTDATRPCPDHLIVPAIVRRLVDGGITPRSITILIAIGMHRPSTNEEKIEKLGREIPEQFRVVDSAPLDAANQVSLGVSPRGTPVRLDRRVGETGLLIATGIVEPHQYAGFSGGWKTVAIGTAGAETISRLHGMSFLEHPGVRLAATEGNPFLEEMRWIGDRAALRFVVNVALDSDHRITAIRAGHPEAVHQNLREWVRARAAVEVAHPYSIVIGGAGHPKDANLYQATRVPTYLCFGRRPAVSRGGVVIVPAACPEGAGRGPGERGFFDLLSTGGGPDALVEKARREGYPAGGQRAVMVAWARQHAEIAIVGSRCPDVVTACGLRPFDELSSAIEWARRKTGDNRILVVPRALTTLPEVVTAD